MDNLPTNVSDIMDLEGNKINSFKESFIEVEYLKPNFIFDELGKKERPSDIKVLQHPYGVEDVGAKVNIIAVKIDVKSAWAKRQRYVYYIKPTNQRIEKGATVKKVIPINHQIEIDIANRKIRLAGPHIHPNKKETDWIYL